MLPSIRQVDRLIRGAADDEPRLLRANIGNSLT